MMLVLSSTALEAISGVKPEWDETPGRIVEVPAGIKLVDFVTFIEPPVPEQLELPFPPQ